VPAEVRFELLGPVRVWRGDDELEVGSPQQRAVLAFLLLSEGRQVAVADVVEALWGSDAPVAGIGTARTYISRLRRVLAQIHGDGPGFETAIRSGGGGYRLLVEPAAVDVGLFRRGLVAAREARDQGDLADASRHLRAGLSLWKGAALAGVGEVGGPFFEGRRAWLEQLRAAAVEEQFVVDIELGRHAEVVAELTAAVAEQPYRERLWELLMWALYRDARQAEALSTYRNVGRLLERDLGLHPGPGLREMHARILASDPLLIDGLSRVRNADQTGRPGQPSVVASTGMAQSITPAQLPRDVSDFVGRVRELADIRARLSNASQSSLIEVTGAVGVGKTTLAVHAAHEIRGQFPDGQLFACLRADDKGAAVDPAGVLVGFLRALGVDSGRLGSLSELAALWRTVLSTRRVLILLDEVLSSEQVSPLLPATGDSAVIVTSTRHLVDLPGVSSIEVGPLRREDACELFATVAGPQRVLAESAVSARITDMCSYLPVPVLCAAQWVRSRASRTIEQLEEHIYQELAQPLLSSPESEAIELRYSRALDKLGAELGRSCRLLTAPDCARLDAPAVAALLDVSITRASRTLEALVGEHFLDVDADGYYFQWFLKVVVNRQALRKEGPMECAAALRRLAELFITVKQNLASATPGQAGYAPFVDKESVREWLAKWEDSVTPMIARFGDTQLANTRGHQAASVGGRLIRSTG
jgi:DNA-binding SARP family transcriptional activator